MNLKVFRYPVEFRFTLNLVLRVPARLAQPQKTLLRYWGKNSDDAPPIFSVAPAASLTGHCRHFPGCRWLRGRADHLRPTSLAL